jgi:L-ribulose-5-phosphate 4-epimerase
MLLERLREIVWKCNQELPKNDLVKMTSGNVSGRDRETGLVVIKPSGYSYEEMRPEHWWSLI